LLDGFAQTGSCPIAWQQHNLIDSLEVLSVADLLGIAIFAIGHLHDLQLDAIHQGIDIVCLLANHEGIIIPSACFVGILLFQGGKLLEELAIACLRTLIAGIESILNVLEATEDITRHIERNHGQEDDIHQVDHLLTGTQATTVSSHIID